MEVPVKLQIDKPFSCKVYLSGASSPTRQVRRFNIESKTPLNYQYIRTKIQTIFPELQGENYTISWLDSEMDDVLISSDEELNIALTDFLKTKRDYFKLYIKLQANSQKSANQTIHTNIMCDGCNKGIKGYRYKCLICNDYDLCSQCDSTMLHPDHCMLRLPLPMYETFHDGNRALHHLRKHLKKHYFHRGNCSTSAAEGTDPAFNPKFKLRQMLNAFGIDIDLLLYDFDQNNSSSQTDEAKKESTPQQPTTKEESDSKNFPGVGKKLIDNDERGKATTSNATSQNEANTPMVEDWTMIDEQVPSNISRASSAASLINDFAAKLPAPLTPTPTVPSNPMVPSAQTAPSAPMVPSAPTAPMENTQSKIYPELPSEQKVFHQNPAIQTALESLIAMGYTDKRELLTYLLEVEKGNINKVLDLLHLAFK